MALDGMTFKGRAEGETFYDGTSFYGLCLVGVGLKLIDFGASETILLVFCRGMRSPGETNRAKRPRDRCPFDRWQMCGVHVHLYYT